MRRIIWILAVSACVSISVSASAETYYIDPDFTGTSDGSITNPYTSWIGQFTFVGGNTYLQKRGTTCNTGTTRIELVAGVTIGAYGTGDKPIILCERADGYAHAVNANSNVIIEDLDISCPYGTDSINMGGTCNNIIIRNCIIRDGMWGIRCTSSGSGLLIENTEIHHTGDDGLFCQYMGDVEVRYCYVHDINQDYINVAPNQIDAAGDCLQFAYCDDIYVHHNLLDHSATGCKFTIISNRGDGGVIEYNHVIGQRLGTDGGAGMYFGSSDDLIIRYNIIENSWTAIFGGGSSTGLEIYGNIFNNNDSGIAIPSNGSAKVYNNTIYNSGRCLFQGGDSTGTTTLDCRNNIYDVSGVDGQVYYVGSFVTEANFVSDYNLMYPDTLSHIITYPAPTTRDSLAAWVSETGRDSNSVGGSPVFEDISEGDFRLATGSPAIDAGVVISGYTEASNVDIGANPAALYQVLVGVDAVSWLVPWYVDYPMDTPPDDDVDLAVEIVDPENGDTFTALDDITITAEVTIDESDSVSVVEFYEGATKLGEDTTSPYTYTWEDVAAGTYTLTAEVTTTSSDTASSNSVNITVATANAGDALALWHFDENSGTVATDSSGNGSDGTIIGADWTTGVFGSALYFTRSESDYVDCSSESGILNMGTGDFTMAAWIYTASEQSSYEYRGIIGGGSGSACLDLKHANRELRLTKVGTGDVNSGYYVPLNTWTHVAVTFDSTATTDNVKFYANGQLQSTATFNYDFSADSCRLGSMVNGNNFDGMIDAVNIYDYVLSASEIQTLQTQADLYSE